MTQLGEARAGHQSNVPRANHRNLHSGVTRPLKPGGRYFGLFANRHRTVGWQNTWTGCHADNSQDFCEPTPPYGATSKEDGQQLWISRWPRPSLYETYETPEKNFPGWCFGHMFESSGAQRLRRHYD